MKRLIILLFLFSNFIFCTEPLRDFASALNSIAWDVGAGEREQKRLEEAKKEFKGGATKEDKRWLTSYSNENLEKHGESSNDFYGWSKEKQEYYLTTWLIKSLETKNFEAAKKLLRLGASPDALYYPGDDYPEEAGSVLQKVIHKFDYKELGSAIEAVKILFAAGMDLYTKLGDIKNTPLHYAVGYDDLEVIKFLLENCAEVDVVNEKGKNPFELFLSNLIHVKLQLETDRLRLEKRLQEKPNDAKARNKLLEGKAKLQRISGPLQKEVMEAFKAKYKKSCREEQVGAPPEKSEKGFWIFKDKKTANSFYNYFKREFKDELEVEKAVNELKIQLKLQGEEKE